MKIGQKRISLAVIVITILICTVLVGSFLFIEFIDRQYNYDTNNELYLNSQKISQNVQQNISSEFEKLDYLSKFILTQGEFDSKSAAQWINEMDNKTAYAILGVAGKDGIGYLTNGHTMDISYESFYKSSMNGENFLSEALCTDNNIYNYYSVPIKDDDKVLGVVFMRCDTQNLEKSMKIKDYKFIGHAWIIKKDGLPVLGEEDRIKGYLGRNLLEVIRYSNKSNEDAVNQVRDIIDKNSSGYVTFDKDNEMQNVYCEPLGYDDLYILSVISDTELKAQKANVFTKTHLLITVFIGLYAVTIIFILYLQTKNKRKIERIAYVDELTGGKSYTKFKKDVEKLLNTRTVSKYALIVLDVDKFKYINDIFGYEEGNNVIRFIWNEINKIVEHDETFAHHNADRFVLLLRADDMDQLIERVEQLAKVVSKRESQNEKNYEIILSVGIYLIDKEEFQIDTAIDRAELTKKSIKGMHNKIYAIYDEKVRQKVIKDQEIENKMERALENNEFKVYYQPKYDSKTCELASAEALVRWLDEKSGLIFPNEFIPVFESNGFIVKLDKYMFENVCKDIRKWLDAGLKVVPISVNLSQLQLYNLHFIDEYREILTKYKIPPKYVQLELTKTTLFSEASALNGIIDKLHKVGFKILMDDFGTGYSSLNMLKNIPVDILKLDKSFVDAIGELKGNIVVSTIISLGQLLEMKIVAEGVETKEQFEFLRDIFCDEIQGYYFSRPISASDYTEKLAKGA